MRYRPPIVVHHHIFKNAGTSIDFSLKKYFGGKWSALEGLHARDIVKEGQFVKFIDANPQLKAISSHSLRPIKGAQYILPIIFIRHPILRAKSVYLFSKKDSTQPNHKEIKQYSFPEYVEWVFDSPLISGGIVINNYQVLHLSDASFRNQNILEASVLEGDLNQAIELIKSLPVFGIVERFSDSIKKYEDFLGKFFNGIKFEDVRLNTTSSFNNNLAEQLKIIRNELGHGGYNKLSDFNELDLVLYEYAQNHFNFDRDVIC